MPRLLFCSYHCYWDPSSGAALCTRELLELLAQRGWSCRVFCGPHFDFEQAPSLAQLLDAQQIPFERRQTTAGAVPPSLYHFQHGGVPVQIFDSPVARPFQAATREEGACFLALYERLLERFRPDLVLTYGGGRQRGQVGFSGFLDRFLRSLYWPSYSPGRRKRAPHQAVKQASGSSER